MPGGLASPAGQPGPRASPQRLNGLPDDLLYTVLGRLSCPRDLAAGARGLTVAVAGAPYGLHTAPVPCPHSGRQGGVAPAAASHSQPQLSAAAVAPACAGACAHAPPLPPHSQPHARAGACRRWRMMMPCGARCSLPGFPA